MEENIFYTRNWVLRRYCSGPLTSHLGSFAAYLSMLGFSYSTGQRYVREAGRLSLWLHRQKISLKELNEQTIATYMRFRCKGRRSSLQKGPYVHLLIYLRKNGLIAALALTQTILENCLREYREHLEKNHGFSADTIRRLMRVARHFLSRWSGDNSFDFSLIRSQDITRWIVERSRYIPLSVSTEVSSLRSFLRFQLFRGGISMDIVRSVPTIRHWKHAGLPTFLNADQIRLLQEHCDRQTPTGQRDTAIVSLLVGLGLRAIEICRLKLDDIHWRDGFLTINGKNGKCSRLPLLLNVGQAISAYLRHGRPSCSTRHLFVRSVPPFEPLSSSCSVANVVRKALARAALHPQRKGTHLLRRSFATQMLERGASLPDIAQILRHESINTTAIYVKVDINRLRPIARAWPEGAQP
jgi:site-specific recombinase XerD